MAETADKKGSLTGHALWILFAKTLAFAFSVALPLLLARRLDKHEFGLYKQVFLVVGTAVALLPLGFAMSAFYFLPREPDKRRQVVFNILLFNAAVGAAACLALAARPALLSALFKSQEVAQFAPSIGVVIMLWIIASFLDFIAIAHQEPRLATVFIVVAQFSKTGLLLVAALAFGSVRWLVYAAVAQGVLQTVILCVYLHARFPGYWRGFEWGVMRRQLTYALPLGFAGMLYIVQTDLHNYVVNYYFTADMFAVYSLGCFQLPLVSILSDSVGSVMIPRVSYLQRQEEHGEIVALTARAMRKLAAVFFPLYALLLVTSREFITFLYTERYAESVPIFAINLTLLPFSIFVLDPVMRAYAEHRYFLLKVRPALIALLFVALWYGTPAYGLLAAISIMVGVSVVERLIMAWKVARIVGLRRADLPLFRDIGKVAAASAVAGLAAALVRSALTAQHPFVVLVACGCAFAPVYLGGLYALGVVSDDERGMIRAGLVRLQRRVQGVRTVDPVA